MLAAIARPFLWPFIALLRVIRRFLLIGAPLMLLFVIAGMRLPPGGVAWSYAIPLGMAAFAYAIGLAVGVSPARRIRR